MCWNAKHLFLLGEPDVGRNSMTWNVKFSKMWHHASSEFFNTLMSNRNKVNHIAVPRSYMITIHDKMMSEDPWNLELGHL